jgi:hypothetical protein
MVIGNWWSTFLTCYSRKYSVPLFVFKLAFESAEFGHYLTRTGTDSSVKRFIKKLFTEHVSAK